MDETLSKLVDNSPLALIVLGFLVLIIAATGSVPLTTSAVNGSVWQVLLLCAGAIPVVLGSYLVLSGNRGPATAINPQKYQIRITNLRDGNLVDRYFTVSGTYAKELPKDYAIATAELIASNGTFRPRKIAILEKDRSWRAEELFGGDGSGDEHIILVGLIGPAGRIVFDYWEKVGKAYNYNNRPSVDGLDRLLLECDRVNVRRK